MELKSTTKQRGNVKYSEKKKIAGWSLPHSVLRGGKERSWDQT